MEVSMDDENDEMSESVFAGERASRASCELCGANRAAARAAAAILAKKC